MCLKRNVKKKMMCLNWRKEDEDPKRCLKRNVKKKMMCLNNPKEATNLNVTTQ